MTSRAPRTPRPRLPSPAARRRSRCAAPHPRPACFPYRPTAGTSRRTSPWPQCGPRSPNSWPELVYKKIDSALRGQIRAELIATMDVLGIRRAVVAPALPSEGRTTSGGRQYADGVPLERSAFAGDGTSSNVVELLAGPGTGPPVRLVELDTVRARSADLSAVLAADGIVVVDAE